MQVSISILLLFSTFQICSANNGLPVFLIDYSHVMAHLNYQPNPFSKINVAQFTEMIQDAIKRSECVINFVEDKLCTEDVTLKDMLGSPYPYLQQGLKAGNVKYLPSVAEPYKTLTQILHPRRNVYTLSSETKLQFSNTYKYLYIYFQDGANDTRAQSLRNHDKIIRDVYSTMKQLKIGPVVGFYTGRMNPIVMEQLKFVSVKPHSIPKDLGVMVVSRGALFRFSGVFTANPARRSSFHQVPLVAEETWSRKKLSTTMAYSEFELQFNFRFGDEQWLLENVALLEGGEEVGRTDLGVGAPWNWSYVCGEPLCVINTRDGSAVTISRYQIQPLRPKIMRRQSGDEGGGDGGEGGEGGEEDGASFGKAVNCGPYFNAQIITGLFVSSILFAILTYGVLMMMSCGGNNKFDDPHGKEPVTHSVEH